ncbi:MAG: glycosyltransferase [Pseudomonadales bacterium]
MASNCDATAVNVLHSLPVWLPLTQTWIYGQVLELQALGVNHAVICEAVANLSTFPITELHRFDQQPPLRRTVDRLLRRFRLRPGLGYVKRQAALLQPDIVHSHFGNHGWSDLGAVAAGGSKHVVTFYGFDVNQLPQQSPVWRDRYQQLFQRADLILAEGSHMRRCLLDLGCPEPKAALQRLGVEIDRIPYEPRVPPAAGEPLKVLIAASFREKKGIPDAIAALAQVQQRLPVELTIIGDAGNDSAGATEKQRIMSALQASNLLGGTRLLGYQPHAVMLAEARAHHLFLQPSVRAQDGDTEGGAPVAIIEMLASGMPVVATQHCDIPEVVGLAGQSLLAPERDPQALAHCIEALSARSDWSELTSAGRAHVEAHYNRHIQARQLAERYRQILS